MERTRKPFTVAEEFWDLGQQRQVPANMQFDVRVAGRLDTDRLRAALAAAVSVHPMARARRVAVRRLVRPSQWEIARPSELDLRGVVRSIRCGTEDELRAARDVFFGEAIDIGHAPALRVLHVAGAGDDALLVSLHHAICDGIGVLHFVRSIARAYAGVPDPAPTVDAVEARYLGFRAGTKRAKWRQSNFRRVRAVPLSFAEPSGATTEPGNGLHDHALSVDETARLNPRRWADGVTINDLLLAALHLAIDAWNARHGRASQRISLAMPLSLRPPAWRDEVMANLVALGTVSTTPEQRTNLPALLAAVSAQTQHLKHNGPLAVSSLPVWMQRLSLLLLPLATRRVETSAVISNLGRLASLPDFGPEAGPISRIWATGPIGMPPGLSVAVLTVNDRLHLSLRYRTDLFDAAAAEQFMAILVDRLLALADDAQPMNDREHHAVRGLVTGAAPSS